MEPYLPMIVPGIFVTMGVACFGYGLLALHRAGASSRWPCVCARVLSSAIEKDNDEITGHDHRVVVEFTYDIEGTSHKCREFFPARSGPAMSGEAARILQERLRGSENVTVAYDPTDPA